MTITRRLTRVSVGWQVSLMMKYRRRLRKPEIGQRNELITGVRGLYHEIMRRLTVTRTRRIRRHHRRIQTRQLLTGILDRSIHRTSKIELFGSIARPVLIHALVHPVRIAAHVLERDLLGVEQMEIRPAFRRLRARREVVRAHLARVVHVGIGQVSHIAVIRRELLHLAAVAVVGVDGRGGRGEPVRLGVRFRLERRPMDGSATEVQHRRRTFVFLWRSSVARSHWLLQLEQLVCRE